MEMEFNKARTVSKAADFFIRMVILFTTVLALYYLSTVYARFELIIVAMSLLVAITIKGVADFIEANSE